jgi:hypothetical protein
LAGWASPGAAAMRSLGIVLSAAVALEDLVHYPASGRCAKHTAQTRECLRVLSNGERESLNFER